ncbi:MAG: glycerophosphoryl diester phosphodiesterase membrane domain-containing protein [Bacteroidota bacterium]
MSNYSKDQGPFRHLWMEGYDFNFGEYLGKGWNLLKSYPFGFLGHMWLAFLMSIAVTIVSSLVMGFIIGGLISSTSVVVASIGSIIGFLFLFALGAFTQSVMAGVYNVGSEISLHQIRYFATFFNSMRHFGQLFLASLVKGVFYMLIAVLVFAAVGVNLNIESIASMDPTDYMGNEEAMIADYLYALGGPSAISSILLSFGLIFLLTLYFSVSWAFTIPLIVLKDMHFWQAMEVSRKTITKKWFYFCLLFLTVFVITVVVFYASAYLMGLLINGSTSMVFIFAICIYSIIWLGVSFSSLVNYSAFEDIVMTDEGGIDELIDNFGEQGE